MYYKVIVTNYYNSKYYKVISFHHINYHILSSLKNQYLYPSLYAKISYI